MKRFRLLLMLLFVAVLSCDTEQVFDEEEQLAIDRQLILDYLAENNIDALEIEDTGIYYVITQQGSGPNAEFANSVFAHYRGYLMDGTEFDNSSGKGPFDFVVGAGQVIRGWELGFQEFNKGASGTLFIPSKFGYGTRRQGSIPPNAVLLFDIDVIDIR